MELLTEQTIIEKPRIDREAGKIYRVKVLGWVSQNGYQYSPDGGKQNYGQYEQMAIGIDHDYESTPLKVDKTWGVLSQPNWEEDGIYADMDYLKSHPLTERVLEDLERGTGLFSLSSVNASPVKKGKVVTSWNPKRCDLVVRGATTKTLLEQNTMENKEEIKEEVVAEVAVEEKPVVTFEQHQELLTIIEKLTEQVKTLELRITKREEYLTPKTALAEQIADATKGIDLKEFWKDNK